jgi:hypothetical protein
MTVKQLSEAKGIGQRAIQIRARMLGLKPKVFNGKVQYFFNKFEQELILDADKKENALPQIIYVHTTWEIRESKLNFI